MAPDTMRPWTHSNAGHPSNVLSLSFDIPIPAITSLNAALVRVASASLHPGTSIIIQLCPFIFRSKPSIPETDFLGTIIAIGKDVAPFRDISPGTPIYGSIPAGAHINRGCGALSDFLVLDANFVVRKPENASFEEAHTIVSKYLKHLLVMKSAISDFQR
jgi:NADPH:quinone reductase-like Zn-dependent oxidoreductase